MSLPEINLIAFLAISIKLFHPFVDSLRISSATLENQEPKLGAIPLNWEAWIQAQRTLSEALLTTSDTPLQPEKQIHVTSKDVFSLNEKEMDSYMDWYERTWTTTTPRQFSGNSSTVNENGEEEEEASSGGILAEILNMFPPSRPQQQATPQVNPSENTSNNIENKETQRRHLHEEAITFIQSKTSIPDETFSTGKNYLHYRHLSDLGDDDSPARIFHERLAEYAGLDLGDLLKAVYTMERRLMKWWVKERKRR